MDTNRTTSPVADLMDGGWTLRKNREGKDTSEIVHGQVAYVSIRLMGRAHADEVALARIILERLNTPG